MQIGDGSHIVLEHFVQRQTVDHQIHDFLSLFRCICMCMCVCVIGVLSGFLGFFFEFFLVRLVAFFVFYFCIVTGRSSGPLISVESLSFEFFALCFCFVIFLFVVT